MGLGLGLGLGLVTVTVTLTLTLTRGGRRPNFVAFSRDAARSDDEGDAGSDMDGFIAKSDAEMSDDDDGAPASGSPSA